MNILCVDDENLSVKLLKELCVEINNDYNVYCFTNPFEALEFAASTDIDVALLDVDMPQMTGIELGSELKAIYPGINIIMVTAYSQYSLDAFAIDASGYLTKPISLEKLKHQFDILRFPVKVNSSINIRINTDGGFQIYINDRMPHFKYSKTMEMLEYLFEQNGSFCSNMDIEHVLWNDDKDHYEYVKSLKKDLLSGLALVDAKEIIVSRNGRLAINKNVLK